jgi:predicted O-methyltransferase YrrM
MALRSTPWMTDQSVEFINGFIVTCRDRLGRLPRVLEFGSGASTVFFLDRTSYLMSFEHDEAWHKKVAAVVAVFGGKASCYLEPRPYSTVIEARTSGMPQFDIIAIDGRDRMLCLKEVLRLDLLAKDGILIVDNTERITGYGGGYRSLLQMLDAFHIVHFEQTERDRSGWLANHRWITTIAVRRSDALYTTAGKLV